MTVAFAADAAQPKAALVRVEDVEFHPRNVRRDLGDLREMVNSIARYGIMQPIVVERHGSGLRLRAGHRRLAAARITGLARVPAFVHAHALTEDDWIMQALHENVMRRNLDPGERADALHRLRKLGCTWVDIADSLGVSVTTAMKWATGQTTLVVVDHGGGRPVSARPAAPSPAPKRREASPSAARRTTVGLASLRDFADAWGQAHGATVEQVIAALRVVADGGRPSEAMPSTGRGDRVA